MSRDRIRRFETVHRATTRQEKEAVYRFRYSVYAEELGRELGSPDHERRVVHDADDEAPYTTILYTGSIDDITGTVRLRHWQPGEVPRDEIEEQSMELFPDLMDRRTGEIGRLMVKSSLRGGAILASFLRESYRIFVEEQGTELVFCYCSPGMVRLYEQIAMRPYGGRVVHAPDGVMLPMVAVISDYAYYRGTGSVLAPMARRYFGPGRRSVLDLEPYRHLLEGGAPGMELVPDRVAAELEDHLSRAREERRISGRGSATLELLDDLPSAALDGLLDRALAIDVPAGTLITRRGFRERELYLVLGGEVEVGEEGKWGRRLGTGELFGEVAFFHPEGRRTASVRAVSDCRLLVLYERSVEKLFRREPVVAASMLRRLGGHLVGQLLSQERVSRASIEGLTATPAASAPAMAVA